MANLVVLSGLRRGTVVALEQPVLIGRSADTDLRLPDTLVSSHHAQLRPDDDSGFLLQDLASTNGTFVNDEVATIPTPVRVGDVLRVGATQLLVTDAKALPAEAPSLVRSAVVPDQAIDPADAYAIRLLSPDDAELVLEDGQVEATLPFVQALQGAFGRAWDLPDLYQRVAERFARAVGSEGVAIALPRPGQSGLEVVYRGRLLDGEVYRREDPDFAIREDLLERALAHRSVFVAQAGSDGNSTGVLLGAPPGTEPRSDQVAVCVPLPSATGPAGAVYLHGTRADLSRRDLDLLLVMASLAGVHLRTRQLIDRLRREDEEQRRAQAGRPPADDAPPAGDEAHAARSPRLLARILEHTPEAIVSMTLDGVVTSWSPGAQALYEHRSEDVVGEPLPTVPDAQVGHLDALLCEAAAGRTLRQRTVRVTASGRELPVAITLVPVPDDDGQVAGVLEISRDIGEELAHEERTRWRERLAGYAELARGLAHELGNPLANLRSGVELLLARPRSPEEARPTLEVLQGELARLQRLTRQALDLTSVQQPKLRPTAIPALLEVVANAARARAEQQDVSIAVEPADALPLALADPDQLERAAGNLVANALAAMPNGGSLELAAIRERNRVGFAVRDTGPGIASPDLARIWDPFFSRTPGGAGMGLALVRQLVDRHDGLIEVESSPGAGTTMRVLLPLATAEGDR